MLHRHLNRLPRDRYIGERTVAFDLCLQGRARHFESDVVVLPLINTLAKAAAEQHCIVPVFCFMPDHLHVMLMGQFEDADLLAAIHRFRLLSGKQLHRWGLSGWQRDFWDHVIRVGDDWRNHATYMAMNPVRAGLVDNYFDYPFLGSIGTDLQDVVLRVD